MESLTESSNPAVTVKKVLQPSAIINVPLTRYQKFVRFLKAPEFPMWPMGFMILGGHLLLFSHIFSDEFIDDLSSNEEYANSPVAPLVNFTRITRDKYREIRENAATFLNFK